MRLLYYYRGQGTKVQLDVYAMIKYRTHKVILVENIAGRDMRSVGSVLVALLGLLMFTTLSEAFFGQGALQLSACSRSSFSCFR